MEINERFVVGKQTEAQKKLTAEKNASKLSKLVASTLTGHDTVQFSSMPQVQELAQQLKESSEVRHEKVVELRQRIASGDYHVSGYDIAAKIVEKAQDSIF